MENTMTPADLTLARYRASLQVPGLKPLTFAGADIPAAGPPCITFGCDGEREYDADGQLVIAPADEEW